MEQTTYPMMIWAMKREDFKIQNILIEMSALGGFFFIKKAINGNAYGLLDT